MLLQILMVCAFFALPLQQSGAQSFLVGQVDQNGTTTSSATNTAMSNAASSLLAGSSGQDDPTAIGFVNQYSQKYKKVTDEDLAHIKSHNLLETNRFLIQFVRHPDDAYGIVTLRVQSPMIIQGCGSARIDWIDVQQDGHTLEISMAKPQLVPAAQMRYPHYECKVTNGTPTVDIPISRNDLIANQIDTLSIKAGTAFDRYNIVIGDQTNTLTLEPLSYNVFQPYDRPNALHHVFYPVNMVILRAPAAAQDENLVEKMNALARRHKLTPIDKPIPNAKPYQFYALDKDYNVMLPLQTQSVKALDTISVDETFQGKTGPYQVSHQAQVYVTLPGEFD